MNEEKLDVTTERDYEKFVMQLVKNGEHIIKDLTPRRAHLWHMASCICGEAGELFDAIKKSVLYGDDIDLKNVIEEFGDIEFYMQGLRCELGLNRNETLEANFEKLKDRYHKGIYSNDQARRRADKIKEDKEEISVRPATDIEEFYKALEDHDWTYRFSDDTKVFKSGEEKSLKLSIWATKTKDHQLLYTAYCNYINSNLKEVLKPVLTESGNYESHAKIVNKT